MKKTFCIILTSLVIIQSCQEADDNTPNEPNNKAAALNPEGVFFNEIANEWQAIQDDYEYEIWDDQIKLGSSSTSMRVGGQIIDDESIQIGTGYNYELDGQLSTPGAIVTGIGLRCDGDEMTHMQLERRSLNFDGTMGRRYRSDYGTTGALMVWFAVPNGYAIVGLGVKVSGIMGTSEIKVLRVSYMQVGHFAKLSGPVFEKNIGTDVTIEPELNLVPGSYDGYDIIKTIITGAAFDVTYEIQGSGLFKKKNNYLAGMQLYIGELK